MIKPLWNFFKLLKDSSPLVLSIDQYHYFFEAYQQLPKGSLENHRELMNFCKIFWLKDHEYEREFEYFFGRFVSEGQLRELFPDDSDKDSQQDVEMNDNVEEEKVETGNQGSDKDEVVAEDKNGTQDDSNTVQDTQSEEFVDFELVISEKEMGGEAEELDVYTFQHRFVLNDQDIMPFKLRHFAQRLRRKVENPVKELTDELDFEHMIGQYSKYGYINEIVYKYRDSSSSNVILLADRYGSMLSYEYMESHLKDAFNAIPDCDFEHFYFKNIPELVDKTGHYRMKNVGNNLHMFNSENAKWNSDSWFFIFSDAGAHSGMVNKGRMRATLKMWQYFKRISKHVYWLNPVPEQYRKESTAERLNLMIPMTFPVQDEFNKFFSTL